MVQLKGDDKARYVASMFDYISRSLRPDEHGDDGGPAPLVAMEGDCHCQPGRRG